MNRRQYMRQFLALFSGSVVAQVCNFAAYPLLARLYTPEEFGLLGTFIAAAAIPGALACGRFDLAMYTAPSRGRQAVFWLCVTIAIGVAAVSAAAMGLYWWAIQAPMLWLLIPLLFATVLLIGVSTALTVFLIRHESFRFASLGIVMRTAVTVLVQLGVVLVWPGAIGLIVGFALGLFAQSLLGFAIASRWYPLGRPRPNHMRAMFRRFRHQVSVDVPGTLLGELALNMLPFLLQYAYGNRAVGYFAMGHRIAVLPLQLFNDALSRVFFQRAARAYEERGEFWQEFRWTLIASGLVGMITLVGLVLLAEPVLATYLGSGWETSATILVILAPMLAIRSVTISLMTTVFVLKRPVWMFWHNFANLLALTLAFGIALATGSGLLTFLVLLTVFQGLEFALFGLALAVAARRRYYRVTTDAR